MRPSALLSNSGRAHMKTHVLCAVVALCLAGCGGKPATVDGTVTLDGEPISKGSVSFVPSSGGQQAFGVVESDGSYSLSTNSSSGLELGNYQVRVVAREMIKSDEGFAPMQGDYIVPKRYANHATSGLSFEIKSGRNKIDLELTSE